MSISTRQYTGLARTLTIGAILALSSLGRIGPAAAHDNGPQRPHAATGTSFTYQGRLVKNGQPVNGMCDLNLSLWDTASGGGLFLNINTLPTVPITNGLFTVQIDYGASPFVGEARWIETAVQCAADAGYVTLSPRTRLTAAPYAVYALNNWALGGNSGTGGNGFVGTTDNTALTIGVNGAGALRIYPNPTSPNLAGGYSGNYFTPTIYGATIAGGGTVGYENRVLNNYGTVGGGLNNQADGDAATISGGLHNQATKENATVAGGLHNYATGAASAIGGGSNHIASGESAYIGGGGWNSALTLGATIGGGNNNTVSGAAGIYYGTIGGGHINANAGNAATIAGGKSNFISPDGGYGVIGGGQQNAITATPSSNLSFATIGGGLNNKVTLGGGTVGGGNTNTAGNFDATVGGGFGNTASGGSSTIPGGNSNLAQGAFSFAAGRRAKANNDGCFTWADANDYDFACGLNNAFTARATGGVYFVSAIAGDGSATAGVQLPSGGNAWAALSDKNSKANFAPIDGRAVMEKLARIPISTWNYKTQDEAIRHIGPMAQDFAAAFAVGEDDKHITTIDADGVSLAALQGLYQIVQEKDQRMSQLVQEKDQRIGQLEREVAQLKQAGLPDQPFDFSNVVSIAALAGVGLLALALRRRSSPRLRDAN